jgi:hypothetical protein
VSVPPSLRSQALAEVGSVVLPREDKATAMRVLSLSGQPSASGSGSAVSTLIRKVSGLRRYRPRRFLGGGDDERGTFGREAALHIPAGSRPPWRSCRLLSALRPMAPSMPTPKDHEKDLRAEARLRSWVEEKADARREYVRRLPAQEVGV